MQQLTTPPMATSPYTPAGGSNMPNTMPQPPKLGTPIPGTTGGLAAKPGLTVFDNPLPQPLQSQPQQAAQQTQQYGRGNDSVLVHMTPDEVNSLRGLAQQFGGDLTTNPHTGLPEAGFLGKLLPTLLGGLASIAFPAASPWLIGAVGAAGGTAATGSLSKGLMMGLGAFGGASLAGALTAAPTAATAAAPAAGTGAVPSALQSAVAQGPIVPSITNAAVGGTPILTGAANSVAGLPSAIPNALQGALAQGPIIPNVTNAMVGGTPILTAGATGAGVGAGTAATGGGGFLSQFGNAAKAGISSPMLQKAAPIAAGLGLLNTVTPSTKTYSEKKKPSEYGYTGPYRVAEDRVLQAAPVGTNEVGIATAPEGGMTSKEQLYYRPSTTYVDSEGKPWTPGQKTTPIVQVKDKGPLGKGGKSKYIYESDLEKYLAEQQGRKYAKGGELFHMESGGHVFPAKAVVPFGNFDTEAGQRKLAKLGGIPIKGPGDGVSDSIPALIDGKQEARVATGEVYFPPEAVKRLGGNKKLYAMMRNAERAANRTKAGDKVKGLGAL